VGDGPTPGEIIALLEATLEATHEGILVIDLDRRILHCNRQCLKMFGFSTDEQPRSVDDILAALGRHVEEEAALRLSSEAVWSNTNVELHEIIRFQDGRVFECFIAPHEIDRRIIGRVASFRDVTRRAATEDALEQHREFLEKAQEVAHIGSWAAGLDKSGSDDVEWSTEACRIVGVEKAELEGASPFTSESFFARIHEDDRDAVRAARTQAASGERPYNIEYRIVRPDLGVRWVHEKADIVRDRRGRAARMIGTVQDITERRQLEDQLRQSQKLEAIGRLAGGIAHDLNNTLTTIAGYAELALGAMTPEEPARADVEEIRRGAERAGSVTRQLLAFSRKQLLEPRLFDLNDTIASVGRLVGRLLGDHIQIRTRLAAVPSVLGDPGQIEQAIINLALNARDAMPRGGSLTLATAVEEVDEAFARANVPMTPGRYVVIRVSDTGHGMSADTQAHIFEPFFTTKEVGKGTGLGLSMVYGTLKQIGGFIFVDSAIDQGTTFRLYVPPAPKAPAGFASPEERDALIEAEIARAEEREEISAPPRQATVLVVEDEPTVRSLVASALRRDGYRLLLAASAEEALGMVETFHDEIDLLLTDAIMPGRSGIELANALAQTRPALRVIIMTGYTPDTLSGLDNRRVELLQKPFTPGELRRRIGEALAEPRP
jgi:PAS domain S-box-containing protein